MKKILGRLAVYIVVLALCAALLGGCSSRALPEGVEKDDVKAAAAATIQFVTDRDFEGLLASMEPSLAESTSAQALKEAWEPILEQTGAFSKINDTTITGRDGYAVAVVITTFEAREVTFTMAYNGELQLTGIQAK